MFYSEVIGLICCGFGIHLISAYLLFVSQVSYPKAIDVWYSVCMSFVFGALLEFAFVNVCTRSEVKLDEIKKAIDAVRLWTQ